MSDYAHEAEAFGFTVSAAILFLAGAVGAWARAVISGTQKTRPISERLIVDLLIGGCAGLILPIFAPILDTLLNIKFQSWTTLQQGVLAFGMGGSGSYFWTAIGWRKGLIVTPRQAASGERPPPPEPGVLKEPKE